LDQERLVLLGWQEKREEAFSHSLIVDIDFFLGTRYRKDIDNMAKLVLDGLNEHAFEDDCAVVALNLRKINTSKDKARTFVRLTEVILWPDES
jgi:Holliday junction resolvase RusA-like endonuclease